MIVGYVVIVLIASYIAYYETKSALAGFAFLSVGIAALFTI